MCDIIVTEVVKLQIQMYTQKDRMKYENIDASIKDMFGKVRTHWHDYYEIELVLEGSGTYVVDGEGYDMKRGDLFFLTPASFHNAYFTTGSRIVNIMFKSDLCDKEYLCNLFSENSYISQNLDEESIELIKALSKNIINCLEHDPIDEKYAFGSLTVKIFDSSL